MEEIPYLLPLAALAIAIIAVCAITFPIIAKSFFSFVNGWNDYIDSGDLNRSQRFALSGSPFYIIWYMRGAALASFVYSMHMIKEMSSPLKEHGRGFKGSAARSMTEQEIADAEKDPDTPTIEVTD